MSRRRIREQNLNHVIEVVVIVSVIKKKNKKKNEGRTTMTVLLRKVELK